MDELLQKALETIKFVADQKGIIIERQYQNLI